MGEQRVGGERPVDAAWEGWSSRRIRPISRQASCELAGEAVVLQLDSGLYYGLDEVGAHVWRCLLRPGEPPTVAELSLQVLESFEVAEPDCRRDLIAFLADLERAGLVEVGRAGLG